MRQWMSCKFSDIFFVWSCGIFIFSLSWQRKALLPLFLLSHSFSRLFWRYLSTFCTQWFEDFSMPLTVPSSHSHSHLNILQLSWASVFCVRALLLSPTMDCSSWQHECLGGAFSTRMLLSWYWSPVRSFILWIWLSKWENSESGGHFRGWKLNTKYTRPESGSYMWSRDCF